VTAALDAASREYLLAFADDEHLIGQGHAEWIGVAPFLEEDLAFCSIAQDELGHAAALYELVAGADIEHHEAADAVAFGRPPDEYRSCHLVELPCSDWAEALARHWLYDLAEQYRWQALAGSSVAAAAVLVERAAREEAYHRRHAGALLTRMLDDAGPGGERVRTAIAALLPYADAIWEPVAGEAAAVASGVVTASSAELRDRWRVDVDAVLGATAWDPLAHPDQRARTARSEHFDALYARITEVLRIDPAARW
jgi:ring-1,2-phenylacetyl-CoA epoxidase subunit PaaC